jgi:hypothetical protein
MFRAHEELQPLFSSWQRFDCPVLQRSVYLAQLAHTVLQLVPDDRIKLMRINVLIVRGESSYSCRRTAALDDNT